MKYSIKLQAWWDIRKISVTRGIVLNPSGKRKRDRKR